LLALTAPEVKDLIGNLGIRLVNFRDWERGKTTVPR